MVLAKMLLHVPVSCVTVVGVHAGAAQPSEEPADEAAHAKTREDAADAPEDDGSLEGIHVAGEGDHEDPSTAAATVDGRPAVLSISTAPDG